MFAQEHCELAAGAIALASTVVHATHVLPDADTDANVLTGHAVQVGLPLTAQELSCCCANVRPAGPAKPGRHEYVYAVTPCARAGEKDAPA